MKCAISSWLHKFADIAEKAIIDEFRRQGLKMDADKAKFAQFLLGDQKNISSRKRPFIWESVYDNPEAKQQVMFPCVDVFDMLKSFHREFFKVAWLHAHSSSTL
jgi:hypothetical protein